MSFFAELNRRNVVRVGLAYVVIGWILAQVAEFAFENFGAPEWVLKTFVAVLLLGLPLALFFAWAFEMTPEGVKREKDVDRSQSITRMTGRKLDFVIIGALAVSLAYFLWERQALVDAVDSANSVDSAGSSEVAAAADSEAASDDGPSVRSIAVLPFVNMSPDKEQEWFSDGLTEEILNALARTPDLLVAARTSSFKFKGSTEDIPTIAAALGVAHVLEGSVRRARDRLRVTAQLIRASDGFHLWSQTYDRNPEDVISIQEDVAIEIATALETAIDPEALENMVSAGTNSVEAYNAYLKGLAFDASTLNTGDTYVFLSARDGFDRAIELDPTFAYAYWELAQFWRVQLQTTNIVSGIVELPIHEMQAAFDDAISKAIEHERDPINKIRYRLRLNTDYLEQRPNDQGAQNLQLTLLSDLQRDDELRAAIKEYQGRDGYDVVISNNSMTMSLISDDKKFIRDVANVGLQRLGDSAFVVYQAHRSLLWAGDVDGASQLVSILQSSDLPEESRLLVGLRQACAENRLSDASQIYDRINAEYTDDKSIVWIGHRLMSQDEEAIATLMELDKSEDLRSLRNFLSYAYFDARPFPNLMALLESQGVEPREPRDIPYQCKL
jgi:TolB-like protein